MSFRGWQGTALLLIATLGCIASAQPAPPKTPRKITTRKRPASRPVISRSKAQAAARKEAQEGVEQKLAQGAAIPLDGASALNPFFEQLIRRQRNEINAPLHILHYGDSHVAADEWTGTIREHLQERFENGGSGFSVAGRPWSSYRRLDLKSGSTRGWHSDGLVGRAGDGVYGLGGVSMSTTKPHESLFVTAEAQRFELFYRVQPGGGAVEIYDNGSPVERISTDGSDGPGYYHYDAEFGLHKLTAETLDHAPVRLFGWVADRDTGITYEALGINGADINLALKWDQQTLRSQLERRNPALIVLSYGTNEAGQRVWTLESYREAFATLIARFRAAAPDSAILVTGPLDRGVRVRGKGWITLDNVDLIIEAQRQAALAAGCAFWDQRAKMGGKGSMREWVLAGMAQNDHVHLTLPGYKAMGDALYRDLMALYEDFTSRQHTVGETASHSPR